MDIQDLIDAGLIEPPPGFGGDTSGGDDGGGGAQSFSLALSVTIDTGTGGSEDTGTTGSGDGVVKAGLGSLLVGGSDTPTFVDGPGAGGSGGSGGSGGGHGALSALFKFSPDLTGGGFKPQDIVGGGDQGGAKGQSPPEILKETKAPNGGAAGGQDNGQTKIPLPGSLTNNGHGGS